ncbi:MAG TPA: iron-sulfur cluster assembly accessory protein [Thermoplasmata archaeon]|nr:iron-sulfur cluster assembly accessory protein [Thermoplasmata archaeon]
MALFHVSEKAAEKLVHIAKVEGKEPKLRVKMVSGGCAGMSYEFEFAELTNKNDAVIQEHGATVIIDAKSALYLIGSQLDYKESLMQSGFVVNNPNVKATCACGTSVTV